MNPGIAPALPRNPHLLFLGCVGLYLSYFPFAQAFAQSVDPRDLVETVGSLWLAVSPYTADLGVQLAHCGNSSGLIAVMPRLEPVCYWAVRS